MRDRDLFQLALVLRPFWQVVSCEFDLGKKRLDIEIDFPPGSIFICPGCGREGCKAYDKEAAYTIKRHWNGILRWFTSKINNGILEGINSLIQAAKAKARGSHTVKNLITMIYIIGAKLEFRLPT